MGKVKVLAFSISLDGFGAGPNQSLDHPLGVDVIRQFLKANLIDEMHLVFSPVLLGNGESLLQGIKLPALGFSLLK